MPYEYFPLSDFSWWVHYTHVPVTHIVTSWVRWGSINVTIIKQTNTNYLKTVCISVLVMYTLDYYVVKYKCFAITPASTFFMVCLFSIFGSYFCVLIYILGLKLNFTDLLTILAVYSDGLSTGKFISFQCQFFKMYTKLWFI